MPDDSETEYKIDNHTLNYTRAIGANLLLLIAAKNDRSQQEVALRMIIERTKDELIRRKIDE